MCLICERVALWQAGENPYFIHEFEHSIFVVGDSQLYRGYSLLLYKEHVKDLHELDVNIQQGLFSELMIATNALVSAFNPDKMNHSCLGNKEPHIHWHIMPRYEDDPFYGRHPFRGNELAKDFALSSDEATRIAANIRQHLTLS